MRPLGTIVGHTTSDSARILAVFDARGSTHARLAFEDEGRSTATSTRDVLDLQLVDAAPYKLGVFELKGLVGPRVRYDAVSYNPGSEGKGGAPSSERILGASSPTLRVLPRRPLRIGLLSCNHIDSHQLPKEQRGAMWRRLGKLVRDGDVDLLIHAGDQVYGDEPPPGWNPTDTRVAAYRRHYVDTWTHPDVAPVLASCPSVMMWDDHEIYDGWGSNESDQSPPAQERYRAAAQAFVEFQGALNPTDGFASGFGWMLRHEELAVVALDGRSQRCWQRQQLLGKPQLDEFATRLTRLAAQRLRHLFVVVGTPIVYVPVIAGEQLCQLVSPGDLDDVRDAWTASNNREECRRLLMMLLDFAAASPTTQVTILAGDVHVGTLAQIETQLEFGVERKRPRIYQVTSSAIGRPPPRGIEAFMLRVLTGGGQQELLHTDIVGVLRPVHGSDHEYLVRHRNFAILDPGDGVGGWDDKGNLWVRFHTEQAEDAVLEQLLPRVG